MSQLTERERQLIEEYRRSQPQQYPPPTYTVYRQINWKPIAITFLLITILLAGSTFYFLQSHLTAEQKYNTLNTEYITYQTKINTFMETFNITDDDKNLDVMLTKTGILLNAQDNRISNLQRYELHTPTEEELIQFLRLDDTNEIYYNEYDAYTGSIDDFVCLEYATKLYNRAKEQGLNISFIACNYEYGKYGEAAHAFNSAKLDDGRTVWIEPQKDRILDSPEELISKIERKTVDEINIRNYGEMWP